ncbi:PAAR domain-containing protein [Pseudomonas sp. Pc102]|uniref:PAAR domain-containing protein n=1 Tax=Pseudomonas sp. Pc102 TaxID=2678261 RepID=UPI001FD02D74|nr:PAAR domain-containing protein [Pseudomonas sp. Pc102]
MAGTYDAKWIAVSIRARVRLFIGDLIFPVNRLIKEEFMPRGFVLLGDKTTHGGQVISASSTHVVHGKLAALVGDLVSCPIPGHGVNPIVEGCADWSENGRALVVDGCRSACGCQVISSAPDCAVM